MFTCGRRIRRVECNAMQGPRPLYPTIVLYPFRPSFLLRYPIFVGGRRRGAWAVEMNDSP